MIGKSVFVKPRRRIEIRNDWKFRWRQAASPNRYSCCRDLARAEPADRFVGADRADVNRSEFDTATAERACFIVKNTH